MVTKQAKIKKETDELLDKCIKEYRFHHKEMRHIPISRDKIIYEIAVFYLKMP